MVKGRSYVPKLRKKVMKTMTYIRSKIYEMICNGATMEEITNVTGKNETFVRFVISDIRQRGREMGFEIKFENLTYKKITNDLSIPTKLHEPSRENNYYFETDEGITALDGFLYFANSSDLMDHFQSLYKCTADEIEFSNEYKGGHMFKKHTGLISQTFCNNHNSKFGLDDPDFYKREGYEIDDLYY